MSDIHIPPLDGTCNSWILTDKRDGKVIGEFWNKNTVARFNPEVVLIETASEYLAKFNIANFKIIDHEN